jgi:3-isopropylmalate dehydrogenase
LTAIRLGVLAGDGIGPEVTAEALKVLRAAGVSFQETELDLGAERFLRTGEVLTDEDLARVQSCDAVLMGAVGDPRVAPGILERQLLLKLRFELDLYVNLRPVHLLEGAQTPLAGKSGREIDMIVVRENTEGVYTGAGGTLFKGAPQEVATQESVNTRHGVDRVLRYAFELARKRDRKHLTLVHKTNVLTYAGDLWMRAFDELGDSEFSDVERSYSHVDAACLFMVTQPERFDVMVTDNMFGDILTDLGAAIAGGIGLASSGNIDPEKRSPSIFEPVHGSAPDIANTQRANPVAAILSSAMLLEHLGHTETARKIEQAARSALPKALDGGLSTSAIGDLIAEQLTA